MPGTISRGKVKSTYVVLLVALVLLFGFTPISQFLLQQVNGSFAPAKYSSLALVASTPTDVSIVSGRFVTVILTNHTGGTKTYRWTATQNGAPLRQGAATLHDGQATTLRISSRGARAGKFKISLDGTDIFVTVNILKSGS